MEREPRNTPDNSVYRHHENCISPVGFTLYVTEIEQDGSEARPIRAYDPSAESRVSNMRVFHDFYPGPQWQWHDYRQRGNAAVATEGAQSS